MKKIGARRPESGDGELPEDPEGVESVALEALDPEPDDAEVAAVAGSAPALDSPGDDAVLDQEELYEGLSSDSLPSAKVHES